MDDDSEEWMKNDLNIKITRRAGERENIQSHVHTRKMELFCVSTPRYCSISALMLSGAVTILITTTSSHVFYHTFFYTDTSWSP